MLPKQYRLKKRTAFKATYKLKHSAHSGGVTLFAGKEKQVLQIDGENSSIENNIITKVGFVVSKKVHKRAVKRNRLKRLMRESYRLLLKDGDLGASQNYISLIFVGTHNALDKNFDEIKSSIKKLLEKI